MKSLVLVLLFASGSVAHAGGGKVTHRVEVDGVSYRVTTDRGIVTAARKSIFVKFDLAERDRQRLAVKKATGCEITDELPTGAGKLRGKLACPAS